MSKNQTNYGSWKSPITSDMIVEGTRTFKDIVIDEENGDIYWVESRPEEQGRYVIVRYKDSSQFEEITPPGFSARTMVYEYGGGAMAVSDGKVYFSNFSGINNFNDQRLFKKETGLKPKPLTTQLKMQYADGVIDSTNNRLICIGEDHSRLQEGYALNEIISIDLDGTKEQEVLVSAPSKSPEEFQRNFYSSPCLNPSGNKLAWLAWNFGCMPWDSNELWIADLNNEGSITNRRKIAGDTSKRQEGVSIFQPQWASDGILYFVSDRDLSNESDTDYDGWWNLYCFSPHDQQITQVLNNPPADAEFGVPQWYLGMSTYGFISATEIIAAYNQEGIWKLGHIDISSKTLTPLALEFDVSDSSHKEVTLIEYVRIYENQGNATVVFTAGGPYQTPSIVSFQYIPSTTIYKLTVLRKGMDRDIVQKSLSVQNLSDYISKSTSIEYSTTGIDEISHAFFYPPTNPDYEPSQEEKPPLLIIAHGGPTASTTTALNMTIQYFTSRGFAVADVNYRGSSGYGRKYRLSLYKNFGILDRDDCVKCAEYLAQPELTTSIDKNRIVARGGSAGGYLTLVLATYTTLLEAGASYYGISDLRTLAEKTHKFESTYAFALVTDQNNPVKEFEMRSPIYNIELLDCPMIFFQGLDDKIVPPDQTEKMVNALKEKGQPVEVEIFPGEGHGFKEAENIKKALEAELNFYSQILEFELADDSI